MDTVFYFIQFRRMFDVFSRVKTARTLAVVVALCGCCHRNEMTINYLFFCLPLTGESILFKADADWPCSEWKCTVEMCSNSHSFAQTVSTWYMREITASAVRAQLNSWATQQLHAYGKYCSRKRVWIWTHLYVASPLSTRPIRVWVKAWIFQENIAHDAVYTHSIQMNDKTKWNSLFLSRI